MKNTQIPDCLASYADAPAWCNWSYVGREKRKVPYNPHTGKAASSTDPRTWGTLADALKLAHARAYRHPYGAIGIVSAAVPELVFLDLDRCIDSSGALSPAAARLLELCGNTYAEKTPSGAGARIIGRADGLAAVISRKGTTPDGLALELYRAAPRYLTVTNWRLPGHPDRLADISDEVLDLLRLLPGGTAAPAEAGSDARADAELIRAIATGEGYHAELCALAARWVGRGMSAASTVEALKGLMLAQPEATREARWTDRFGSIPALVQSAADKYTAPREHRRSLAWLASQRLRRGDDPAEVLDAIVTEGKALGVARDVAEGVVRWVAAREVEARGLRHG
jgi:hypothetical protein